MILCYWNSRCFWFIWVLRHWSQEANFIKENSIIIITQRLSFLTIDLLNSNRTSTLQTSPESALKDSKTVFLFSSLFFFPLPSTHIKQINCWEWNFRNQQAHNFPGMGKLGEVGLFFLWFEKQLGMSCAACVSSLHRDLAATHLKANWQLQERTQTSSVHIFPLQHSPNKRALHWINLTWGRNVSV